MIEADHEGSRAEAGGDIRKSVIKSADGTPLLLVKHDDLAIKNASVQESRRDRNNIALIARRN